MMLGQRQRQQKREYVRDREEPSLKIKIRDICASAWGSRSVARFEYSGVEPRTLFAKDMSLDIRVS